jgi:hypothetical protein
MWILVTALGVAVAALTVLVAGLLRSHADILRLLHDLGVRESDLDEPTRQDPAVAAGTFATQAGVPGPRPGDDIVAADLVGATPDGRATQVGVVGTRHSSLLAFLSTGCTTCRDFWDAFKADVDLPGRDTRLVIVTKGPEAESPPIVASLAPPGVTLVMSSEAWDAYAVPVAPYFLLVDGPSGEIIGEGAATSWTRVANLLRQALADTGRSGTGDRTRLARASGAERAAAVDDALLGAGIGPGDPRLYHGDTPPPS